MVRRIFALGSVLLAASTALASTPKQYQIGDRAEEDVVTPIPLVVIDSQSTEALKEREARRIHVVYRFHPNTINDVESAFRSTFATTRSNFLDHVHTAFGERRLSTEQIASTNFQQLVTSFQKQNVLFPVNGTLAGTWAGGSSSDDYEASLVQSLRETMKEFIRSEESPEDVWVGSTLRLVSLAPNEVLSEEIVLQRGTDVPKANFVSHPRARTGLQERLNAGDKAVGRYVASFVQPNCTMEADLTRAMRRRRMEGLVAADRYEPGTVIVRRGQVVDAKIKAALDQLREKTAAAQLEQAAATQPVPVPPAVDRTMIWLAAGMGGSLVVLLLLVWTVARQRAQPRYLPAPLDPLPQLPAGAVSDNWQQRALVAEHQARNAQAMVRAGLLAHLAQWLSDRMTRKLISQRAELVDAHQKAAMEMAELEARLEKVQAPLQDRLHAYERRIAELEKELSVKGEENRELIKAKIRVVRKQLEIEREKSRVEFN
jgi:hypothetical protein